MLTYASPDDYLSAVGDDPDNCAALLRTASRLVRQATRAAIYDVLPSGAPSDATIAAAFREATVTHAAAMAAAGITGDPAAGRAILTGQITSSSIGKASVQRATVQGADEDRNALLTFLCPDALWCLESAGVLSGRVQTW